MSKRDILVTSALPYANGDIHLGHLLEYIQTDIWVRFLKTQGHTCWYVCGDDTHGTPVMLSAQAQGVSPEAFIAKAFESHVADFQAFHIGVDNFYTTHSKENCGLAEGIFAALQAADDIVEKTITQAYDPEKGMFLPDRFVRGACPKCRTPDQYGDSCEACGATYAPVELIDPISVLSGATPIEKASTHLFFKLGKHLDFLRQWFSDAKLQPEIVNKLQEWFDMGLQDWCISRDEPYFGFAIPGYPGKYFYVWLDAPVGYMASFKALCERQPNIDFDAYWGRDSKAELYHFIGKDIMYFHTLFWPAVLHSSGYRLPSSVIAHGFITINGEKMSKSRGTFIKARTFVKHLPADTLRYYYAAKLNAGIQDIDLNLDDFVNRINADLVGKVVNIASRCAGFIHKHFADKLANTLPDPALYNDFIAQRETLAQRFEELHFSQAVREIMQLADRANQYIDQHKPWQLIKDPLQAEQVQAICTQGINLFRVIMTYLAPIIPHTSEQAWTFLNAPAPLWEQLDTPLLDHAIQPYQALLTRLDTKQIATIIEESKSHMNTAAEASTPATQSNTNANSKTETAAESNYIGIDDFSKVELKVGRVLTANAVEGADKLVQLSIDLGQGDTRQVFAGIKAAYTPESLCDRLVVVVANLAPRKMRFGVSEAMVLVATDEASGELKLIAPPEGTQPGSRVK